MKEDFLETWVYLNDWRLMWWEDLQLSNSWCSQGWKWQNYQEFMKGYRNFFPTLPSGIPSTFQNAVQGVQQSTVNTGRQNKPSMLQKAVAIWHFALSFNAVRVSPTTRGHHFHVHCWKFVVKLTRSPATMFCCQSNKNLPYDIMNDKSLNQQHACLTMITIVTLTTFFCSDSNMVGLLFQQHMPLHK